MYIRLNHDRFDMARRLRWTAAPHLPPTAAVVSFTFHGEAAVIATNFDTTSTAYRIHLQAQPGQEYRKSLRAGVGRAVERGERCIVVDCSSWEELDLILLSALVDCATVCDERGVDFALEHLTEDLRSRIEALRLGDRLGLSS